MTSVLLALAAGVFLHVSFKERDRTTALYSMVLFAAFTALAVWLACRP